MKIFLFLTYLNAFSYNILVLGDSLTEGLGVSIEESFPFRLEKKLQKAFPDKKYRITNGGFSGATTASGPRRLKFYLKKKYQLIIISLGANDGLRGINLSSSEKNLEDTVIMAKKHNAKVLLVGMKLPLNYGDKYITEFNNIFKNVSKKNKVPLYPFLLKNVAGKKEFNLKDNIHPNAKGYEVIANDLYNFLVKNILTRKN